MFVNTKENLFLSSKKNISRWKEVGWVCEFFEKKDKSFRLFRLQHVLDMKVKVLTQHSNELTVKRVKKDQKVEVVIEDVSNGD